MLITYYIGPLSISRSFQRNKKITIANHLNFCSCQTLEFRTINCLYWIFGWIFREYSEASFRSLATINYYKINKRQNSTANDPIRGIEVKTHSSCSNYVIQTAEDCNRHICFDANHQEEKLCDALWRVASRQKELLYLLRALALGQKPLQHDHHFKLKQPIINI